MVSIDRSALLASFIISGDTGLALVVVGSVCGSVEVVWVDGDVFEGAGREAAPNGWMIVWFMLAG